jgi:hypothetical protein
LLLVYGALAWSSVRQKSTTFDELAHVTAGYSYWLTGDYRLHPENGILPQRWATLPLLLHDVRFPALDQPSWREADVWKLGYEFFYKLDNDLDRMLWSARGMIVLFGIALGAVVYTWSRQLFGPRGALLSLAMFAISPTCLAHGRLATSDLTATLAFVAALGCLWIAAHRLSLATVSRSAVVMGLLFVSKMSAVLILPIGLVLIAVRLAAGRPLIVVWRGRHVVCRRGRQLAILVAVAAVHAVVVAAVIWLFYGFQYEPLRDAQPDRDFMYGHQTVDSLTADSTLGPVLRWMNDQRLLPNAYLHGFAFAVDMSKARSAFLNGRYSIHGWKTFFPYCFLVKTPLATMAILLAAAAAMVAQWRLSREPRRKPARAWTRVRRGIYRTLPIWVFLAVYWAVAIFTHLNIGHRHILPTYPLLFILCGAAAYWFDRRHRAAIVLVASSLIVLLIESAAIYPHYLAYFNRLAVGPRHAYRHLVDSSLDWGQDLPGLKRWLTQHRAESNTSPPVYLSYFGTGSPEYYGIEATRLPGYMDWRPPELVPLRPGTYCISATTLQCIYIQPPGPWIAEWEENYWIARKGVDEFLRRQQQDAEFRQRLLTDPESAAELAHWNTMFAAFDGLRFARLCAYLRRREPLDSVGYSILIYQVSERDLDVALNRPLVEW